MNLKRVLGLLRLYAIFTAVKQKKPNHGPPDYDPSDADLEMVVDSSRRDCGLPPVARSPEQGIADMKARVVLINEDKRNTLNALLDDQHPGRAELLEFLDELNRELAEAQQRLTEYETQAQGKN
jgi:hypothetical protein